MKYRVRPTSAQWVLIVCAVIIFVAFVIFGIWEIAGIVNPAQEDTFSEWVWDLDLVFLIPLTAISLILAIVLGWFTIHIWEGYVVRRRWERRQEEEKEQRESGR